MRAYLKTQLLVLKRTKGQLFILLILLASIFLGYVYNLNKTNSEQAFIKDHYDFPYEEYQKEQEQNQSDEPVFVYEYGKFLDRKFALSEAINNKDSNYLLVDELKSLHDYKEHTYEMNESSFPTAGGRIDRYLKGKELLNTALLSRNISPESTRYGTSGALLIVSLLPYLTSFAGLFVLGLCASRIIGKKYEGNQYRWLKVTPLPYIKQLLADYLLYMFLVLVILGTLLAANLAITYFFSGDLNLNYPILVRIKNELQLMSASHYIAQVIAIFLLILSVIFFLSALFVRIVKNSFISVLLATLMIGVGYNLSTHSQSQLNSWNPFVYTQPTSLLIGRDEQPIDIDYTSVLDFKDESDYVWVETDFTFENISYYQAHTLGFKLGIDLSFGKAIRSLGILTFLLFTLSVLPLKRIRRLI
ncbi:hypothetical protein BAU15_06470 [Enterococcus sp. JM4C]|uniref:hypothetical protein n=1 Tax=Candidatus Enterococcus huntleyi TaxID=1857217 RepID=UPI00137A973A|nr:hypothetical protein [Enterococcus sp. JM4C]KAF1297187.1 hypothetical protein BAU15_06470 [Enterococcus sp. JM4C]